jgi:predicted RNase H-like HicB family nuclease
MLLEYIQAAMDRARYEILSDDGSYYGRIPGFKGLWANANTLEECRRELQSALEEWLLLGIRFGDRLPVVKGIRIRVPKESRRVAG